MDNEQINKAAAAREARRRKILENSNKRLGKITGRVHNEETPLLADESLSNGIYPDPEMERDVYEPVPTLGVAGGQDPDIMEVLRLMQGNPQDPLRPQSAAAPLPETPISKFIKSPIPLVFIALFTYFTFAFNFESAFGGHVFAFFVVWEILVFTMSAFVLKDSQTNQFSSIIALLPLFLPRLNTKLLQFALKVFTFSHKLIRDIAIFLFTFVGMHIAFNFLYQGESINRILDSDFNRIFPKDI